MTENEDLQKYRSTPGSGGGTWGQKTYGGNGEEQGIFRSLISSEEHFFHRFDVVS